MPVQPTPGPATFGRRRLMARAAAVAAGAVGVLSAPALTGSAAAKSLGNALLLGGRNKAGDAQTRLQSSPTVAALSILNSRARTDTAGAVDIVAAQVRLESPVPGANRPQVPDVAGLAAGDLAAAGGLLYFGAEAGDFEVIPSQVHTGYFANYLQPVDPAHAVVLDTRTLPVDLRSRFPASSFDAAGRLRAGQRIGVDFRGLVNTAAVLPGAAVALSIEIVDAVGSGTLSCYTDAEVAAGVQIASYTVLPGTVTATGVPFALPATAAAIVGLDPQDRLWLAVDAPAQLVLRVTGVFVPDPTTVVDGAAPVNAGSGRTGRLAQQRQALRGMLGMPVPK